MRHRAQRQSPQTCGRCWPAGGWQQGAGAARRVDDQRVSCVQLALPFDNSICRPAGGQRAGPSLPHTRWRLQSSYARLGVAVHTAGPPRHRGQSFTPFQGFGAPSDAASPLPCLTGKIRSPYSTWHGRGAQKRERLQQADHRVRDSLQALLHGGGGVCGVNRALIVTLEQKNAQIGARLARESGRRAARAHDALGQGVITSGRNPASAAAWSRHASV